MFTPYVSVNLQHTLENNPELTCMNYTHQWVNHSEHFVDPDTDACTNAVEGIWEIRIKRFIKVMSLLCSIQLLSLLTYFAQGMRGMPNHLLPMYIDEFLWRSWFLPPKPTPTMALRGIVSAITKYYEC